LVMLSADLGTVGGVEGWWMMVLEDVIDDKGRA